MAVAALATVTTIYAEEAEVSVGADVVSRYVWRGMDQGSGASLQPTLSLSYGGLSVGAWGSTSLSEIEPKEIDLSVGYSVGAFSAVLTDYFWAGESAKYGHYTDDHFLELGLSYVVADKLTISWATMLALGESAELDEDGDRMFSTYVNFNYDIDVNGVIVSPYIGFSPWKSQYSDDFAVMDFGIKGAKDIKITDSFTLPVYAQAIFAPANDKAYLVFGITF